MLKAYRQPLEPEPTLENVHFLTFKQAKHKLQVGYATLSRMLKTGQLVGIRVPGRNNLGDWRIVDPGTKFVNYLAEIQRGEHTQHLPLLNIHETAAVMGTSVKYVKLMAGKGNMVSSGRDKLGTGSHGGSRLFSVVEIRRKLWDQEKRNKNRMLTVKIQRIIEWASAQIDEARKNTTVGVRARDEMEHLIDDIMLLPEPGRTQSLIDMWRKVDKVETVLQIIRQASVDSVQALVQSEELSSIHQEPSAPQPGKDHPQSGLY